LVALQELAEELPPRRAVPRIELLTRERVETHLVGRMRRGLRLLLLLRERLRVALDLLVAVGVLLLDDVEAMGDDLEGPADLRQIVLCLFEIDAQIGPALARRAVERVERLLQLPELLLLLLLQLLAVGRRRLALF